MIDYSETIYTILTPYLSILIPFSNGKTNHHRLARLDVGLQGGIGFFRAFGVLRP
jgi:hypothetical protein